MVRRLGLFVIRLRQIPSLFSKYAENVKRFQLLRILAYFRITLI